jgi:glycosyltransferase involved in cell wall biosynthesis
MTYSPIIVFAFNRPEKLKKTINSLLSNPESKESDLFVFVDGPRADKTSDNDKVQAVRDIVTSITGFNKVVYTFSKINKGLAQSIITGTTDVIKEYGRVIVLEDDLYVSADFLRYMNQMLDTFEHDNRVFQVSGFSCRVQRPKDYYYDVYFSGRSHSWSWGTWKDRWKTVDWDVSDFDEMLANKKQQKAFCTYGSDLYGMLSDYMKGRNNSWYIRFNYAMHKQSRYSVCPLRSLVRNDGFGEDATHCNTYNRYKTDFESKHIGIFRVATTIQPDKRLMQEAVKYWSIPYRIYGKGMNIINKMFSKN